MFPTAVNSSVLTLARATLSTAALPVGTHDITAHYLGATGFDASDSSASPISHTVTAVPTTTTLTSSGTPAEVATTVTLTATVSSTSGTPTGNVTFWDGPVGTGTNLGTFVLNGSGQAVLALNSLALGSHAINAAYDGGGNFAASTSTALTQIIQDTTPPQFTSCPMSFAVEATSAAGAPASWAAPTATDNSGAPITPAGSHVSGSTFPLGATLVTFFAADASGNPAVPCAFTVTVQDTTAPQIGAPPADITVPATSASGAVVTFSLPTASDAVTNPVVVTASPASGSTFPIGTTLVTLSAVDGAGNPATPVTFNVTVEKVATTARLKAQLSFILPGQTTTLTATITAADGSTPTGNVTFTLRGTELATVALSGGVATFDTAELPTGIQPVKVTFAGSAVLESSQAYRQVFVDPRSGPEFRVNASWIGEQALPRVAKLSLGRFVVAWQSLEDDPVIGPTMNVYVQRYDRETTALGAHVRVNTTGAGGQPVVAGYDGGGFVVVWQADGSGGGDAGVFGQVYWYNGEPRGTQFRVDDGAFGAGQAPAVVATDTGFAVVWVAPGAGGDRDVRMRLFAANGIPLGGSLAVHAATAGDQAAPVVAALVGGGFAVSWETRATSESLPKVYAQRLDANGGQIGSEFPVTTIAYRQHGPAIAALANGGFVIAWGESPGVNLDIFAQRYLANGDPDGAPRPVNTRTAQAQRQPAIAALPSGGYVVTWASLNQDGSGYGIYAQRYNEAGQQVDVEFQVHSTTDDHQWYPDIVAMSDASFISVWTSRFNDDGNITDDVFAQRLRVVPPAPPLPTPALRAEAAE